eukprot:5791969-Prymnesium_polylepis.1
MVLVLQLLQREMVLRPEVLAEFIEHAGALHGSQRRIRRHQAVRRLGRRVTGRRDEARGRGT